MGTSHAQQARAGGANWESLDSLGARLRVVLGERNMTQSDLARKAGLSTSYVSMLISGQRGPRISHAAAASLRKALRVPAGFFAVSENGNNVSRS